LGGSGGWGGEAAKQGKSLFMAKIRRFICRLSASQISEHFLPEIKDVAFCKQMLKSVLKIKSALL
jgi:hypothetical protein